MTDFAIDILLYLLNIELRDSVLTKLLNLKTETPTLPRKQHTAVCSLRSQHELVGQGPDTTHLAPRPGIQKVLPYSVRAGDSLPGCPRPQAPSTRGPSALPRAFAVNLGHWLVGFKTDLVPQHLASTSSPQNAREWNQMTQ